jgi:hypothetical protein
MKKRIKLLSFVLVLSMLFLSLFSCGSEEEEIGSDFYYQQLRRIQEILNREMS